MAEFSDLTPILRAWLRRLRLQRAWQWAQRGLAGGLALGLSAGLAGLFQARLLRGEFLALVGASALAAPIAAAIAAYLWPVESLWAARSFDRLFHLQERVSTALELHRGKQPAGLTGRQLDDAIAAARRVDARCGLPLRIGPAEGLISLCLIFLLGLAWLRGAAWFDTAQQARAVEQAVQAEAQSIEQLLTQIENDPTLTPEQQAALSTPLEAALNDLRENPSLEGSVSVLNSTGERLQALTDPQADQTARALQQAGQQLAGQEGSPLEAAGRDLAAGRPASAAARLADLEVSRMSAAEAQQAADQLESMAQALEATDPQLADALNRAAQALRSGERAAAQQALGRAAGQLAQTGQQLSYSQTAELAAGQVQDGAGRVLAAGGGQGQAGTAQNGSTGGAGSGRGSDGSAASPAGEAGSAAIPQGNGAGDGGESAYEPIYAPSLIGGEGGESLDLPPAGEDGQVVGLGPTTPGEPGVSNVPYDEVYAQYDQANRRAIDSGAIPNDYLDIIRNYFDSIEPE